MESIIQARCVICHTPGGISPSFLLNTYGGVYNLRFSAQGEIAGCLMPEADAGQLTPTERAALLGWLVCGAPNN